MSTFFDLPILTFLILFIGGFVAAFLGSISGGAGLITIPLLLMVGLSPTTAIGTNKFVTSLSGMTSIFVYVRHQKIDMKLMKRIFPVVLGGILLGSFTVTQISSDFLRPILVILLVFILIHTMVKKENKISEMDAKIQIKKPFLFYFFIFLISFYNGFFGPGGSSLLLFLFVYVGYDYLSSVANGLIPNFISSFIGVIVFGILGFIHIPIGITLGVSMTLGAFVGSKYAILKGMKWIRIFFIFITSLLLLIQIFEIW